MVGRQTCTFAGSDKSRLFPFPVVDELSESGIRCAMAVGDPRGMGIAREETRTRYAALHHELPIFPFPIPI